MCGGEKRAGGSSRLQSERAAAAPAGGVGAGSGVGSGAARKRGVAGATPSRLGRQSTGGATRTPGDRGRSKELTKLQDKLKRELLSMLRHCCTTAVLVRTAVCTGTAYACVYHCSCTRYQVHGTIPGTWYMFCLRLYPRVPGERELLLR